jgi:hypothetical protein
VPQRIELDAGRAQRPGPRGGAAPGERADAQDQLGEVEGLGQVVVGAQDQAADPVGGLAGRGEHQDHRPAVPLGDHPAQVVAVDAGQVAVEHDDVVGGEVELGRGGQAVVRDVDGHPAVAQALGQHRG